MSEQANTEPKKKGKLPIVLILAIVLGAGGFFGMKMRGGGEKKKEPEIKLGAMVEIKEEFLTNMAERSSYVRAKIALQMKEGYAGKTEEDMPAIQDAINMKLQDTSVREVATLEGMRKLKRELAASINKILAEHEEKKDEHKDEEGDKEDKKDKKEEKPEKEKIPEGWDSAKGPVLKVLFVSFATQ